MKTRIMYGSKLIAEVGLKDEVVVLLERFRQEFHPPNPVFLLLHPNGNGLYILLSTDWCSAVYEDQNGDCYMVTNDAPIDDLDEYASSVRFNNDGHPTHMPIRNCIRFEDLVRIAAHFTMSGQRTEDDSIWEYWGKVDSTIAR